MDLALLMFVIVFFVSSLLVDGSTVVLLSRTLMEMRSRDPADDIVTPKRSNRERSVIIGAISPSHQNYSNRTRLYEDDDDGEDEDDYENRFIFVGTNYHFMDDGRGRKDGIEEDGRRNGRKSDGRRKNEEGTERTGKGIEIGVKIERSPERKRSETWTGRTGDKARKSALKQDRLRRQESLRTIIPPVFPNSLYTSTTAGLDARSTPPEVLSPLGFLDAMQLVISSDCLSTTSAPAQTITLDYPLPQKLQTIFTEQTSSLVQIANVLNNLFANPGIPEVDQSLHYKDAFYYSLVRAVVESHDVISAAAIVFDRTQYETRDHPFGPFAYRNRTNGRIYIRDLVNVSQGVFSREEMDNRWSWLHRSPSLPHDALPSSPSPKYGTKERSVCDSLAPPGTDSSDRLVNVSPVITQLTDGRWSRPYFDCSVGAKTWMLTYSLPFFSCSNSDLSLKGVVKIEVDLGKVDIDQCPESGGIFENTHRCDPTTTCVYVPKHGFRRGGYRCHCQPGFYFPNAVSHRPSGQPHVTPKMSYFNGSEIERSYLLNLTRSPIRPPTNFACLPCADGCDTCDSGAPCLSSDDFIVSMIALALQSFTMTSTLLAAVVVIRLRHTKVMKASFWLLLEIIIVGALMMYATVVIQYVSPSDVTCILIPWFREVGFVIVYGSLMLKVYRVLAEFQSRKAQRILLRDKDLLKYLAAMVTIVIGYMVTWTVINVDHIWKAGSMVHVELRTKYFYCKSTWWDYVIEIEECLFLFAAIYICYRIRSAPSFYLESKYISWAIYNETAISAIFNIVRHCLWLTVHPNYLYWMYFIRCQLTVTVTMLLVIGTKVWYTHRPPDDAICRRRTYSTTDAQEASAPEATKLTPSIGYSIGGGGGISGGGGGEGDVGDINLTDMNPEDIRAELKRLYTQLQIYKTKSMRKDNPHISKRRGGRKPTHRRFSLQAFHYNKHKLHQGSEAASGDHENEASRSPEESTNSVDVVPAGMVTGEGDSYTGGCGGGSVEVRARSTSLSSRTASGHR